MGPSTRCPRVKADSGAQCNDESQEFIEAKKCLRVNNTKTFCKTQNLRFNFKIKYFKGFYWPVKVTYIEEIEKLLLHALSTKWRLWHINCSDRENKSSI